MSDTLKNIMVLVVGVVLLGGGYYLLFMPNSFVLEGGTSPLDTQLLVETQQFIQYRQTLESITLDTAVLDDVRFTSLRSFETPVVEQSLGKESLFDGRPVEAADTADN
jgi:hypothetical protein